MYILTSNYFPTDYWPDLYFPVLPEGADIQYKEVVEFTLELITNAPFTLEMPVTAPFTLEMPQIIEMEVYEELSL
jgi:hypothetical protein